MNKVGYTYRDENGTEYRVVNRKELHQLDTHDPLATKALEWLRSASQSSNSIPDTEYYLSDSLMNAIELLPKEARGYYYMAFVPPTAGLTFDDFLSWGKAQSHRYGRSPHQNYSYYTWSRQYSRNCWRSDALGDRVVSTKSFEGVYEWYIRRAVGTISEQAWRPRKAGIPEIHGYNYAEVQVLLWDFLHRDGFEGSLEDFIVSYRASASEADLAKLKTLNFLKTDDSKFQESFWHFLARVNTASLAPSRPKAVTSFLLSLDREVWTKLVLDAPVYSKGKTLRNLEELVSDIKRSLGQGERLDYEVLTPEQLQRDFTVLFSEAVLFEGPYYNPAKLHGLAMLGLDLLNNRSNLETYAKEYSHILHKVKELLAADREAAELQLILAEGDDEARVREAAKSAGKLTLMQTLGLFLAINSPRGWIRGTSTNGPYLLGELLEAEGLDVIQFVSEVCLEDNGAVPTETEWRKAMGTVPFNIPAGLGLSLIAKSDAKPRSFGNKTSDPLVRARGVFARGRDTKR